MKKLLLFFFVLACFASVSYAGSPGGGMTSDSCAVVLPTGESFTYIASQRKAIAADGTVAREPHIVEYIAVNKLKYAIFFVNDEVGYVATLIGWVDSYDYYEQITVRDTVRYNGIDVEVTAINSYAFFNGWGITGVKIGANVIGIFPYAFYGCNITELYIPINVCTIKNFSFCRNPITSVRFQYPSRKAPSLEMYNMAFGLLKIGALELPARLLPNTYIQIDQSNPISHNPYLSEITLNPATGKWSAPESREQSDGQECWFEIINKALCVVSGSENDRTVTVVAYPPAAEGDNFELSENRIEIDENAFAISPLRNIALKSTSTSSQNDDKILVRDRAFAESPYLATLSFEAQGDISLQGDMAYYCPSLTDITIGNGVSNYSNTDGVIYQMVNGEKTLILYPLGKTGFEFSVPADVLHLGAYSMAGNDKLTKIDLPEGLLSIGDNALMGCYNLTSAIMPNSIQSIGNYAFYDTQLHEVIIPAGIQFLGSHAFCNATVSDEEVPIGTVTALCTAPPLNFNGEVATQIFNQRTLAEGTLIIPDGVAPETFTQYSAWNFANIVSAGVQNVETETGAAYTVQGKSIHSCDGAELELIGIDGTIVGRGATVVAPRAGLYLVRKGSICTKVAIR